ncbi:hypothetical protein RRG08_019415 [Elysia crispata]|uniref:Uncharacterized protein n=1 Tax=Elysia crispata TaxID=231223 RepID=A0AAE0Z3H4_9GAST|nr:hypothetical protein RRG08_019415 [Elysia crispata]
MRWTYCQREIHEGAVKEFSPCSLEYRCIVWREWENPDPTRNCYQYCVAVNELLRPMCASARGSFCSVTFLFGPLKTRGLPALV